jgi:hypothetical protein
MLEIWRDGQKVRFSVRLVSSFIDTIWVSESEDFPFLDTSRVCVFGFSLVSKPFGFIDHASILHT